MEDQFIHFPIRAEVELHPEALELVDVPPAPVSVTSRCAEARLRISPRTSSRPISSEIGSGRFVGGNCPGIP
jgi:hypothetical protein